MSKPSQRIIQGLLKLHFNTPKKPHFPSPTNHNANGFSTIFSKGYSTTNFTPTFTSKLPIPISPNGILCPKFGSFKVPFTAFCRNYTSVTSGSVRSMCLGGSEKLKFNPLRLRNFSTGIGRKVGATKVNPNLAKKMVDKPLSVVSSTFSRYRGAIGLQIEGFWKRNYLFMVGACGVFVCILLWRIMFGIANTFVGLSEGMAKYGFLALSSAMVAFAGLYFRARYTINPDKVYRMAMRELNTSAGILEVMGAPLAGTELRAYVMSGGGLALSKFKPRLRSKRCFLIFPIRGSERKGLVSVEVKKSKGKYDFKLLAVDIPMASGPDQRLYLMGDEHEYKVGDGLIADLRDPVIKAMAAAKEFEEKDDIEAEEDEERELQEAEQKHQEEVSSLEERPQDNRRSLFSSFRSFRKQ